MHSARSECRGFTVPFACTHRACSGAWMGLMSLSLYEPFDARTRDLLGQDLEPCFGWEKERIWKNIMDDHLSIYVILVLWKNSVFDVFGMCCFMSCCGLMWSALALPLLIHPQNSYQSLKWHLTWKFCACQDLLLRWCHFSESHKKLIAPKHKSDCESWLIIYSRLGHAEICSISDMYWWAVVHVH